MAKKGVKAKSKPPIKQKYIESPEKLWELFENYKLSLKQEANEWLKVQYVGKDGDRVTDPMKLPMTMEGFRRFGHTNNVTIKHYFDNPEGSYDSYRAICSRVTDEIRENQITGGLLGVFNPSITQRLNGLKEQTENTNIEQPLFPEK
jgi:hypothetical protein